MAPGALVGDEALQVYQATGARIPNSRGQEISSVCIRR